MKNFDNIIIKTIGAELNKLAGMLTAVELEEYAYVVRNVSASVLILSENGHSEKLKHRSLEMILNAGENMHQSGFIDLVIEENNKIVQKHNDEVRKIQQN